MIFENILYGLSLSDSINKENLKRYILSLKIVYKATLLQIYKKIIKPYITLGRGNTSDDAWGTDAKSQGIVYVKLPTIRILLCTMTS